MIVSVDDIKVGDTISYQTKNPHDAVTYQGKVTGICAWGVVQNLQGDLIPYYQSIKNEYRDMAPIEELEFFVLSVFQNNRTSTRVVAKEWIIPSSLIKLELANYLDFRIYDRTSDEAQEILNLLKSHGYQTVKL
jgi:hypothetical protein